MRISATSVLAVATLAGAQTTYPCFFDSGVGATFDATNLMNATYDYTWTDVTDIYTLNQTFLFNFCQNTVGVLPPACSAKPASPAYRVRNNAGDCLKLGYDQTSRPMIMNKQLIDPVDPSEGWQITYPNGDNCGTVNAAMTIMLRCGFGPFPAAGVDPITQNMPSFIDESNNCQFTAFSWSHYGCPLECPVVNGRLCGGNGVCGYDNTAVTARCFCYNDWIESDCQTPRYPTPVGAIAGAAIGGILIGALAVLGYAFWAGRAGGAAASSGQVEGFYGKI